MAKINFFCHKIKSIIKIPSLYDLMYRILFSVVVYGLFLRSKEEKV
jgi:hypothetical protein